MAALLTNEPGLILQHLKIGSQLGFKLLSFSPAAKNLLMLFGVLLGAGVVRNYVELISCADAVLDIVLWLSPALLLIWSGMKLANHYIGGSQWMTGLKESFRDYRRLDDNLITAAVSLVSYPIVVGSKFYVRYLDPIFKSIGHI